MVEEAGSERNAEREGSRQNMGCSQSTQTSRGPGLMGPIFLITLGLIFLIGEFVPEWGVRKSWPVLLIVIGVMKLLDSARPPRPPEGPRL